MLYLITGGSGSGKSAFAEEQGLQAGEGQRIYIATMIPYGKEGKQRVERHRQLRREKKFETMECYKNLASLKIPRNSVVLLECMSNLVANEIFEPDGAHEDTVEEVCRGIASLLEQTDRLFVVTNDGQYIYGIATAEDCGGGIKGNRIDLYFPTTAECFQFGVRQATIYVLGNN